jgi:hypothetical protein
MNNLMIFRYLFLLILLFFVSCASAVFRHQSPAFTVTYPSYFIESEKIPEDKPFPEIIFFAKYRAAFLKIIVMDRPKELEKLDDSAQFQIRTLKFVYPRSSEHAIVKEELITLKDGTRAMSSLIKWRYMPGYPLFFTSTVRAFKDKKVITVNSTVPESISANVTEKISQSLEFGERKIVQQKTIEQKKTEQATDSSQSKIAQQKDSERVKIEQQEESSRRRIVKPNLPGDAIRVAVMDFRANGIPQLLASNISELVRNELIIIGSFIVLERSQVDQILKEQGFQMTGCVDTSCAVKVGQMLSAKKILVGTVMKVGNKIVISGRIVDIEKGVGEKAAHQSMSSTDELEEAAGRFVKMLSGN